MLTNDSADGIEVYTIRLFLPENETTIKDTFETNMAEIVQCSFTLILILPLFVFIISRRQKILLKASHKLYTNLIFGHVLLNVVLLATSLIKYSPVEIVLSNALLMATFVTLIVLTIERAILIKFPFRHKDIELKHSRLMITCCWIPTGLFLIFGLVFKINQSAMTLISTVLISLALLTLTISNIMIYRAAKKHDNFVKRHTLRRKNDTEDKGKLLKASYVCFAVVFSFLVLWSPFLVHNILAITNSYHPSMEQAFSEIVGHIGMLNSLVDGMLLIWLNRDINKEVMRFVKTLFQKPTPRDANMLLEQIRHLKPKDFYDTIETYV